jgi:hypothetical protein
MTSPDGWTNATPYEGMALPLFAPDGREVVIAVLKATFDIRGDRVVPAAEPLEVETADVHVDPKTESSVLYPSDISTAKLGTDLVVVGDAVCPKPVEFMDVAVHAAGRSVAVVDAQAS